VLPDVPMYRLGNHELSRGWTPRRVTYTYPKLHQRHVVANISGSIAVIEHATAALASPGIQTMRVDGGSPVDQEPFVQ